MRDPKLRDLLSNRSISLTTGVFDVLSAKLAERAGFAAVMVSGYSVAATYLGEPDVGILTQTEVLDVARRIVGAVSVPVLVDGDTGGGGTFNVQKLVRELVRMGAAGVFLEDQVWPKRCGHMEGKEVVAAEIHAEKLNAAREAKGSADFIIVGRTDARAPLGLDEAIRRGRIYKEAGADLVFVEAPLDIEELRRIADELPPPLLVNMVEGGKTPLLTPAELEQLGFAVVVYPLTGLLAYARAVERVYSALVSAGETAPDALMSFDEFNALVGLERYTTKK
jgi:methylisocitrate lyase